MYVCMYASHCARAMFHSYVTYSVLHIELHYIIYIVTLCYVYLVIVVCTMFSWAHFLSCVCVSYLSRLCVFFALVCELIILLLK